MAEISFGRASAADGSKPLAAEAVPIGTTVRSESVQHVRLGENSEVKAQQAWRLYFETTQRISRALESELKVQAGLVMSDYNTLLVLWEAPEHTVTMSVLARKLVFSPSRLNYRIKVLEDAGLVSKKGCADDKRAHNVTLTAKGAEVFLAAGRLHKKHIDEVFLSHVSDEEIEVLGRVFGRIDAALED